MTQTYGHIPSPEQIMLPLQLQEAYQSERQHWNDGKYGFDFVQLALPPDMGTVEFGRRDHESGLRQAVELLSDATPVKFYGPESDVLPVVAMFAQDGQAAFYDVRKDGGATLHLLHDDGTSYSYIGKQECNRYTPFTLHGGTQVLFGSKTIRPRKERRHGSEGQEPPAYTLYKELVGAVTASRRRGVGKTALHLPSQLDGSHDIV